MLGYQLDALWLPIAQDLSTTNVHPRSVHCHLLHKRALCLHSYLIDPKKRNFFFF